MRVFPSSDDMGKMQREKGARAERQIVHILQEYGIDARRGQVFNGEPDVMSSLPIHIEVKRQETTKIHEWMKQSQEQNRGLIPTVVHRRSREDWLITMKFEDFLQLLKGEQK